MFQNISEKELLDILGKLTRYDSLVGLNIERTAFREFPPAEAYYWLGFDSIKEALEADAERFEKIMLIVDWIDSMSVEDFMKNVQSVTKEDFVQATDFEVLVSIAKSYQRDLEKAAEAEKVNKEIMQRVTDWINSMNKYELIAMTGTDNVNEVLHTSYDDLKPLMDTWQEKGEKLRADIAKVVNWLEPMSNDEREYYTDHSSTEQALKNLGMYTLLLLKNAVEQLTRREKFVKSMAEPLKESESVEELVQEPKREPVKEQVQVMVKPCRKRCMNHTNKQLKQSVPMQMNDGRPIIPVRTIPVRYHQGVAIKQIGPYTVIVREG